MQFVASNTDQKWAGYTTTRTRVTNAREPGEVHVGAFEALLDQLAVNLLLSRRSPLMVRLTSRGWNTFTRTEAVAALRLMIGSSDRDSAQYALRSGRIGGATQLAAQGVPERQIQRTGRYKS